MFIFIFERERERQGMSERGSERKRKTQNLKRLQALSCQHQAQRGARTHMLWDHDLSRSWLLSWLSHPGAPVQGTLITVYTGASGKFIIFLVFRKNIMENFAVCVCVRKIESIIFASSITHFNKHIWQSYQVHGCGIQCTIYLISGPFLSPCPQNLILFMMALYTYNISVFYSPLPLRIT